MKILLDNCTPVPLRQFLPGHSVDTAYEMGWAMLRNGRLLEEAEKASHDLLITTDRDFGNRAWLDSDTVAVLLLTPNRWSLIRSRAGEIIATVEQAGSGEFHQVHCW